MALKETLVRLKRQQESAVSLEADKTGLRNEWITAADSLVTDFRSFLKPFEADGSLIFREREISLNEDLLGTYTVAALTIEAGPAKIELTPVARVVVGAIGRFDLARQGYPHSSSRILILRQLDENSDKRGWILRMPREVGATPLNRFGNQTRQFDFDFLAFDRSNVERAIDFLLSL